MINQCSLQVLSHNSPFQFTTTFPLCTASCGYKGFLCLVVVVFLLISSPLVSVISLLLDLSGQAGSSSSVWLQLMRLDL